MSKITEDEIYLMDPKDLLIYQNWGDINNDLIEFGNRSTLHTFKRVFDNSEHLWELFVTRLNRNIFELLKCLTCKQRNELLVNIHTNKIYLYS